MHYRVVWGLPFLEWLIFRQTLQCTGWADNQGVNFISRIRPDSTDRVPADSVCVWLIEMGHQVVVCCFHLSSQLPS